jgi:hypothetical protein
MQTDPILREVYRIKDELNREIGGDVEKLFDRFREFAEEHPERMAKPAPKSVAQGKPRTANRKTAK